MPWWQALILGIVQGLGEFLPISSSGHLVLFQNIFGFSGNELLFDTLLHLGTLAAVFIALWSDIWDIFKKPIRKTTLMIIIATIPAVIVAVLFGDFLESLFSGEFLGWGFLLTAVILLLAGKIKVRNQDTKLDNITFKQSIVMGILQAIAIFPGVSRSGSTISGGLITGGNRDAVTRFAFLMSIPAILGSVVFQIKDIVGMDAVYDVGVLSLIIGMTAACISGFFALKWMLKLVKNGKLWIFGVYVGALGVLVVLDKYLFNLVF